MSDDRLRRPQALRCALREAQYRTAEAQQAPVVARRRHSASGLPLGARHGVDPINPAQQPPDREFPSIWLAPQVDRDGGAIGHAAEPRWPHGPERSGQSSETDLWVLRNCCRAAARWRDGEIVSAPMPASYFKRRDFAKQLSILLQDTGLPPQRLELEIGESEWLDQAGSIQPALRRLAAMGTRLALGDVGGSRSSLRALVELPFHRLKIHRGFVTGLRRDRKTQAVVRALVELGRGLDVEVMAVGVETRAQLAILREIGCAQFQGALIGAPRELDSPYL